MKPEINKLISTFKSPILKNLKELKDKAEHFFDNSLSQYLETQKEKQEYTKTFLFRDEQVKFYNTYFPISVTSSKNILSDDPNKINTATNCFSIFDKFSYQRNYIMIIGYAGSGKSMLMKHLFLESISKQFRIPIFIELRVFNNVRLSLLEYLTSTLFIEKTLSFENMTLLKKLFNDGRFLFLLDGFDEIYSEHKLKILEDITNFVDLYSKNLFVITSRPGANMESFSRFHNFYVAELEHPEIFSFIELQLKNIDANLANQIINTIQKPENEEYVSYLKSPLFLSMFILTYSSHPELPRTKAKFYLNVFDTLLTKHDSIKMPGYQHQRTSNLLNEEIEVILKWFSYISFFDGQYSFTIKYLQEGIQRISQKLQIKFDIEKLIYDLTTSISILIRDGIYFRFPHRTLQEFFAAILISEQGSEVKAKIYKNKFKKLEQRSHSGNDNFLNLCVELDRSSFYKNWAIPSLQSHLSQVTLFGENKTIDIKKTVISFLNSLEIEGEFRVYSNLSQTSEITFTSKKEFLIINKLSTILKTNTGFNILKTFEEKKFSSNYLSFFKSLVDTSALTKNTLRSDSAVKIYSFSIEQLWSSGFYSLVERSSFPDEIKLYIENIQEKIKAMETEIKNDERTKNDLLDL